MKEKEKEEVRRLRKENGESIKEIARKVGVSQGSVSLWVRDIKLTAKQKEELQKCNPIFNRQINGSVARCEQAREERIRHQENGRKLSKTKDEQFIAGCMLYWAEGSKSRCSVIFTNTDSMMMKFFITFLRKYYGLKDEDFSLSVHWYSDNELSLEEIQKFWINRLSLPHSCFRKCIVDNISKYSQKKKKNRHPYGTCRLIVNKVDVVQSIYGAIQEFIGFDNTVWLD